MNTTPHKKILVRMPNWLGDLVMATPILADLKKAFPEADITALCQGAIGELLEGSPHLSHIHKTVRPKNFREGGLISQAIRKEKFDLAILLTNSFSSAWRIFRGKVKKRIGFQNEGRSFLLTKTIKHPKEEEHLVTTYKRLLVPLGIAVSETAPQLFIRDEEREYAQTLLRGLNIPPGSQVIGFNTQAAYGPAKCWPKDKFKALASKLSKHPQTYLLFFGDKNGAGSIEEICSPLGRNVFNLAGKTNIRQFMSLLSVCSLLITNDSGPMHVAAALKTPLIALFGSTNEKTTGPYHHGEVIHKHVSCSPCYLRECPIDFKCMNQIEADEVYNLSLRFLQPQKVSAGD